MIKNGNRDNEGKKRKLGENPTRLAKIDEGQKK